MDLFSLTIDQASQMLAKKEISSQELTLCFLDRIQKYDENIGAFITVDEELALEQAKKADEKIAQGRHEVFTGIPVAIKDIICTKGLRTTCASKILENFVPQYHATVVEKIRKQDAVIIGKTNLDEFAMGASTENSALVKTRNPWNPDHVPGGSSGGSAAAVAARFCCAALGTDTGGSIRQPSSHCGLVGIKPTYGRVSRFGVVPYASSLDQVGPMTRTVTDAALMLNLVCGHDPKDSTSSPESTPDFYQAVAQAKEKGIAGMKAGIPVEYASMEGTDPQVMAVYKNTQKVLESLGVELVEVSLPHSPYAVAAYYIIAPCEAGSNLARFDGVRYGLRVEEPGDALVDMYKKTKSQGFGKEVQRRILIGTYALSSGYYDAYYKRASQVRTLIMKDYEKAFQSCDMILSPVAPTPAFGLGEKIDDPLTMYLTDMFTVGANMAGIPGMSLPAGFSSDGLPIGIQLAGARFDESSLIKAGFALEQALDISPKFPQDQNW